jgi:hypothetical protein
VSFQVRIFLSLILPEPFYRFFYHKILRLRLRLTLSLPAPGSFPGVILSEANACVLGAFPTVILSEATACVPGVFPGKNLSFLNPAGTVLSGFLPQDPSAAPQDDVAAGRPQDLSRYPSVSGVFGSWIFDS